MYPFATDKMMHTQHMFLPIFWLLYMYIYICIYNHNPLTSTNLLIYYIIYVEFSEYAIPCVYIYTHIIFMYRIPNKNLTSWTPGNMRHKSHRTTILVSHWYRHLIGIAILFIHTPNTSKLEKQSMIQLKKGNINPVIHLSAGLGTFFRHS
jgi:hypothetical protein